MDRTSGKKKFAITILISNEKFFVICIVALSWDLNIYLFYKNQLASLLTDNTSIAIFFKYANFADFFFPEFATKLLEYTGINEHLINLINDQQQFYSTIYSLESIELKILKTYIKTNLAHDFIQAFKLPAEPFILFVWKLNSSF